MVRRIIDISVGISQDMPVYPGDPKPSIENIFSIGKDGFAVSKISMGTHTGTHIDAPSHIIDEGGTIDMLPLDHLVGKAIVLDLSDQNGNISSDILDSHFKQVIVHEKNEYAILLLKTSKSRSLLEDSGTRCSNVCFDETAGQWILNSGFRTVGIDLFSIDSESNHDLPNHKLLLKSNICIIENLDLSEVEGEAYDFVCLPLKLVGCDGSPARAILIER